jgi:hypothetical protein
MYIQLQNNAGDKPSEKSLDEKFARAVGLKFDERLKRKWQQLDAEFELEKSGRKRRPNGRFL